MRRILTIMVSMMLLTLSVSAREYSVSGPQGGLSLKLSLPKGFNPDADSCHMVILMHGIFSSKDYPPMPQIAKALAKEGIGSIRFDFDPKDPPEYIKYFHHFKLGRNYLLQTQDLDIYETAERYQGPVCIIHGSRDGIVPLWCSEKYQAIYSDSRMNIVEGENHLIIKKRKEVIRIILDFLKDTLK